MKIQAPASSWRRPNDDAAYSPQAFHGRLGRAHPLSGEKDGIQP